MTKFLNPYHFVPSDAAKRPDDMPRERMAALKDRQVPAEGFSHVTHDRYVGSRTVNNQPEEVYSGRLLCRLATETPLVIGAHQTRIGDGPAVVQPYKLPDGSPAIPGSSLRGLISSVLEAATNSALRVLADTPYSYRAQFGDGLGAIGMVVEKQVNGNAVRMLRPLTFPSHRLATNPPADETQRVEEAFQTRAGKLVLPVYLDGYRWNDQRKEFQATGFLSRPELESYSSARWEQENAEPGGFWSLPTASVMSAICQEGSDGWRFHIAPNGVRVKVTSRNGVVSGRTLVALQPIPGRPSPTPLAPSAVASCPTRGILRVLGISSDRTSAMPHGKKHELFIPVPDLDYFLNGKDEEGRDWDLEAEDALHMFENLARQRTECGLDLPFELAGQPRCGPVVNKEGRSGHAIRLRAGDLVYFKPHADNANLVKELAIASIWRHPAESAHAYFRSLSPELLPFHPERTVVTVAEQLLGFVETGQGQAAVERQALTLASRLRFADGWLAMDAKTDPFYGYEDDQKTMATSYTLQELSSPKPPCPTFYFKQANAAHGRAVAKKALKSNEHQPQGRKFYLHDPRAKTSRLWETRDQTADSMKRKNRVTPLRAGLKFFFHIDFDNLSRRELALLLYCLRPTAEFRHKLGMGKPLGLGTIRIDPAAVLLVDRAKRYGATDLFGGQRYHTCHVLAKPDAPAAWADELPTDRYQIELPFLAASPDKKFVNTLVEEVRKDANQKEQRAALEQLGDPNATDGIPIHYPQTAGPNEGDARFEQERYKWWVNNDKGAGEFLAPLPTESALPSLTRDSVDQRRSGPGGRDSRPRR
jgi:RAMP superfamily